MLALRGGVTGRMTVRRQRFWNQWLRKRRECLAHLVGLIEQPDLIGPR